MKKFGFSTIDSLTLLTTGKQEWLTLLTFTVIHWLSKITLATMEILIKTNFTPSI